MKVGKLRGILDGLPYDTEIVINGRDHNYRIANVELVSALIEEESNALIEDFCLGTGCIPESYTQRVSVLLVE